MRAKHVRYAQHKWRKDINESGSRHWAYRSCPTGRAGFKNFLQQQYVTIQFSFKMFAVADIPTFNDRAEFGHRGGEVCCHTACLCSFCHHLSCLLCQSYLQGTGPEHLQVMGWREYICVVDSDWKLLIEQLQSLNVGIHRLSYKILMQKVTLTFYLTFYLTFLT